MGARNPRSETDLPALWADYKELASRCLPERAGRLVQSRRFDRLLLAYALYSCIVLGLTAICLVAWPELLEHVPGWSVPPEPKSAAPVRLP